MSTMMKLFLILAVSALSNSAPTDLPKEHPPVSDEAVCGNKIPHSDGDGVKSPHGVPQSGPSPYTVALSENTVAPRGVVRLTISGQNQEPIRGLVLKAKCDGKFVGSFASESLKVDLRNCGGVEKSGVLYIDMEKRDVPEIVLDWTAPPTSCDKVEFHAKIMKDGSTYWDQTSSPLAVAAGQTTQKTL